MVIMVEMIDMVDMVDMVVMVAIVMVMLVVNGNKWRWLRLFWWLSVQESVSAFKYMRYVVRGGGAVGRSCEFTSQRQVAAPNAHSQTGALVMLCMVPKAGWLLQMCRKLLSTGNSTRLYPAGLPGATTLP